MTQQEATFEYLIRLGDTSLILGHRLSELCSHGPILEEDIALTNIALDHLGQAQNLLDYAGKVEGKGRNADALAYRRTERDFRSALITQLPNEDFAWTIAKNFFFDAWQLLLYQDLSKSSDSIIAGIAEKGLKEAKYHLRHSTDWVLRLGDGTEESHERMQIAVNEIWPYTGELFFSDEVDTMMKSSGVGVDMSDYHTAWFNMVKEVLTESTIEMPAEDTYMQRGSRDGVHLEYLGFMLSEMQYLQRTYPDATW
jgi:ring-1,2-phenylacetyl-CoA epoxidase subunit PaaC